MEITVPQNKALFQASRDFVCEGLKILAARKSEAPTGRQRKWVPQNEDVLKARSLPVTHWHLLLDRIMPEIQEGPTYARFIQLMHEDPIIGALLGEEISYASFGMKLSAPFLARNMLVLTVNETSEFQDKRFAEAYAALERLLYAPAMAVEFILPIRFFDMVLFRLDLGSGISITRLSNDELDLVGANFPTDSPEGTRFKYPRFAVKLTEEFDKSVGGRERKTFHGDLSYEQSMQKLEQVITCLKIFKRGDVTPGPIRIRNLNPLMGSIMTTGPIQSVHRASGGTFVLDQPQAQLFKKFWRLFTSENARSKDYLSVAVRRFRMASDRHHPEDRIIDLMITAEALFLSGGGEKSELGHKLSQRAGYFLGEGRTEQVEVQAFFKQAYKIRSRIVHGGRVSASRESPDLRTIADQLEGRMRRALHKAIELAADHGASKSLVNWEELVLSKAED